jgi:hypothetical protein
MTATLTATHLGKCVRCGKVFRSEVKLPTYSGHCDECEIDGWRPMVKWAKVNGKVTATACTEVCTSAKSTKCQCECGGENHGAALGRAW